MTKVVRHVVTVGGKIDRRFRRRLGLRQAYETACGAAPGAPFDVPADSIPNLFFCAKKGLPMASQTVEELCPACLAALGVTR